MTLVLIEVPNEAAVERLRQQPDVRVVGVVAPPMAAQLPLPLAAPRQWAGSIPATSAEAWEQHIQKIRNEWQRDM